MELWAPREGYKSDTAKVVSKPRSPVCGPRDAVRGASDAHNYHGPQDPMVGSTSSATLLILMIRRIR